MKKILILLLLFIINSNAYSFETLLFKPLTANHLESRIGTFYQPSEKKLRLDIGHSLDLMEIVNNENLNIRAGGDFFILSRLRSEGKFKFPVETSDFFFGLNLSGKVFNDYSFRMRVAHISSHLVDGYTTQNDFPPTETTFIQEPFVYSREFVDLVLAYNTKYIRPYICGTAVFSTIPKDVYRFVPQIGLDVDYPIANDFSIIGGYDLKLFTGSKNNYKVNPCNSAQLGIMYKLSANTGLSFNIYHYSGHSIHGMFYFTGDEYTGFGIQFHY